MKPQRIFGFLLLVVGVILLIVGMNASHSMADIPAKLWTS